MYNKKHNLALDFFPDISNKFSIKKSIKNLFQNSEKMREK